MRYGFSSSGRPTLYFSGEITLSPDVNQLKEANLPPKLAASLAGQWVTVEVFPEEMPGARRAEPGENPILIDRQGNYVNDYNPARLHYWDEEGRVWQFPRHWLTGGVECVAPQPDANYPVKRKHVIAENLHLPSNWDLVDISIPAPIDSGACGKPTVVEVHLSPNAPVRVSWTDSVRERWRLPNTWRRRLVKLPAADALMAQNIPREVAVTFAHKVVSVNYHPGSLCCLPDSYRFRDEQQRRWPVKIQDCLLLGYGAEEEHLA